MDSTLWENVVLECYDSKWQASCLQLTTSAIHNKKVFLHGVRLQQGKCLNEIHIHSPVTACMFVRHLAASML